ncbi:MAG: AI-2E family transporter [Planctomycetota bacterium]
MTEPNPSPQHPWHDRHLWQITFVRDLFVIAIVLFLLLFGYYLRSIFTPVLIAFALAYLFHPVIGAMQKRWRMSRVNAIVIIIESITLAFLGVACWIVPVFVEQLVRLVIVARSAIRKNVADLPPELYKSIELRLREWSEGLQGDPWAYLADQVAILFTGANIVTDVIGGAAYIAVTAILVPLYFFFIASQFDPLINSFKSYIPASGRAETLSVIGQMDEIVSTYFRSRVLISLIMGVLLSLGWALAGVPFWFILGMVGGLLSLIPFASAAVWPVAVGLVFLQSSQSGEPFSLLHVAVWPSLVFGAVQAIEGWVLTPLLQGRSLNMSAMSILIVVFIGGAVGGLYGLILCIPVAACVKILASEVFLPRLHEWAREN